MLSKKLLLSLSILLFCIFVFFSYLVAKETFTTLDFDLTVKFQDHISRRFDTLFSVFSYLGSVEITGIIWLVFTIYSLIRKFWLTFFSMMLLPIALGLELFGKIFVLHPAPTYMFYRGVFEFNFPSSFVHTDYSYPSGHLTRSAFLVALVITYFHFRKPKSTQIIIIPILSGFLLIMAVSRIYLGEHWTTDVIGGILVGLSTGLAAGLTIPAKKLEPDNP